MLSTNSLLYTRDDLETMFLPIGQMLQIDRVTLIEGGHLTGEVDVEAHWVFPLHFPNDPIYPGSLLIEAAGQAVAIWGWHSGLRGRPRLVKVDARFEKPILPHNRTFVLEAEIKRRKNMCMGEVEIFAEKCKVANIKAMLIITQD